MPGLWLTRPRNPGLALQADRPALRADAHHPHWCETSSLTHDTFVVWFVLDLLIHARRDSRAGWPAD
jgi:hypothetical protein